MSDINALSPFFDRNVLVPRAVAARSREPNSENYSIVYAVRPVIFVGESFLVADMSISDDDGFQHGLGVDQQAGSHAFPLTAK